MSSVPDARQRVLRARTTGVLARLALVLLLLGWAAGSAASAGAGERVTVEVLEKHGPSWLRVEGTERFLVRAGAAGLEVDGSASAILHLPYGQWRLRGAAVDRVYVGALRLASSGGAIAVRIEMPLERYVAAVVAAESEPDTPPAALRALAIVARSYALAARGRHPDGALCDLAHCQVMAGEANASGAHAAAEATAGQVLLVRDEVAPATFHAACGGHTADPREIFGGADRSGAAAVADPLCDRTPWNTDIGRDVMREVASELLGAGAAVDSLRPVRGSGGYVVALLDPATGVQVKGEAFARALDRAAGRGVVRSPRFRVEPRGDSFRISGSGHGHGAGLCQEGAARRARRGDDAAAILAHYFPGAHIGRPH